MKLKFLAAILLLLAGCASDNHGQLSPRQQVSPRQLEQARDAQAKWLKGLERGQPIQDIKVAAVLGTTYLFEVVDRGRVYQYVSAKYPITETLYGLYFESGQLNALLLDEDVIDFYSMERSYRHDSDEWLETGMERANNWLKLHDLLERDFDARLAHSGVRFKQDYHPGQTLSGEDVAHGIEIATYMPLAVIGLAAYVVSPLLGTGENDKSDVKDDSTARDYKAERRKAKAERKKAEAARHKAKSNIGKVLAGVTTSDDLLSLMGPAEWTYSWVGGDVWVYDSANILIGAADGIVVWKEIGSRQW